MSKPRKTTITTTEIPGRGEWLFAVNEDGHDLSIPSYMQYTASEEAAMLTALNFIAGDRRRRDSVR